MLVDRRGQPTSQFVELELPLRYGVDGHTSLAQQIPIMVGFHRIEAAETVLVKTWHGFEFARLRVGNQTLKRFTVALPTRDV